MALSDITISFELRGRPQEPEIHSLLPIMGEERFGRPTTAGFAPPFEDVEPLAYPKPLGISPAGFDLAVGSYIKESDTLVSQLSGHDFLATEPEYITPGSTHVLQPDKNGRKIYYITTREALNPRSELEVLVDARSTTGRVGCMCHNVGQLDTGERILAVQPYAFPIQVTADRTCLAQAIVRYKGTNFMEYEELKERKEGLNLWQDGEDVFDRRLTPNGLIITLGTKLVYAAKQTNIPIDMDVREKLDSNDFFESIEGNSHFDMEAGRFYLTGTREVIALDNAVGRITREHEFSGTGLWGHFAGYIQPGFIGPITMECWTNVNRRLKDGETIGLVLFDKVDGRMSNGYSGAYQDQKVPRLPKMFKSS